MHDEAIVRVSKGQRAFRRRRTNVVALLGAAYAQAGKRNDAEKVLDRLNSLYRNDAQAIGTWRSSTRASGIATVRSRRSRRRIRSARGCSC